MNKKSNNFYSRISDYNNFVIDALPYRTHAQAWSIYYDAPQKRNKKHVRGCDYHDNAHQLTTFARRKRGNNLQRKNVAYLLNNELLSQKSFLTLVKKNKIKVHTLTLVKNTKDYNVKDLYIIA